MKEEKEIFDRKRKVALFSLVGAMALTLGIVTYAYFGTKPTNDNPLTIDATTGNLSLIFRDGTSETVTGTLNFGDHITKYFELENNGSLDAYAQINFANLINTYTSKSLRYELKYRTATTGDYTETAETVSKNVPVSETTSTKPLAKGILIPAQTTYYFELTITLDYLDDVDQTNDFRAQFQSTFLIEEGQKIPTVDDTLTALGLKNANGYSDYIKATPPTAEEFSAGVTSKTEGMYAMEDDYGTSYYYRGDVTKNYVKFGKWKTNRYIGYYSEEYPNMAKEYSSLNECQTASEYNYNCTELPLIDKDMYWRIIRINGDGSLRMIYDGTQAYENRNGVYEYQKNNADRFIKTGQAFNANSKDAKYVGYKYGGQAGIASTSKSQAEEKTTDSDIKVAVEAWYEANLKDEDKYLADGTFCIDRSISANPQEWWSSEPALDGSQDLRGYGQNNTAYGGYRRFVGSKKTNTPQFTCPRGEDILTEKIGLITADEVVAAGASTNPELNSQTLYHYLKKSSNISYWTLSPSYFSEEYYFGGAMVTTVNDLGTANYGDAFDLGLMSVSSRLSVAPVINLSAEYVSKLTGEGTTSSPFELSTGQ